MSPERSSPRYDAVGFDLLTALLHTWTLWIAVAGDRDLGMRWHAASQAMLRGRDYYPFEDDLRRSAAEVGVAPDRAEELIRRWGEFDPWPDTPGVLGALTVKRRFIVTNCSDRLAARAVARLESEFELVMTAERAGAYKPDARPYRAALDAIGIDPGRVLFVAGSAHDVGGATRVGMDVYWANRGDAPAPKDARAIRVEPDLRGLVEVVG